jgi:FKBP-type peptidyl-prolyl cis-trans isomerase
MKNLSKLFIALLAIAVLGVACSKHPGFKKDKEGLYYKFHIVNKGEAQPQMGDIVDLTLNMRTIDSVLFENAPLSEKIVESLFPGDFFAAVQKMHLGDSATFIIDGESFFTHFFGQEYPFEHNDLYFDMKLNHILPKEEFEAMQAERMQQYELMIEELRVAEDSLINDYIIQNKIKVAPTEDGIYFIKTVSGKGKAVTLGSIVSVHYTGKLLDGAVFDSSLDYGTPFEVTVGQGQVIPGWEKALLLMREGDKATVLIPSKFAYGNRGIDYVIPPCAPLVFDMEIISVE